MYDILTIKSYGQNQVAAESLTKYKASQIKLYVGNQQFVLRKQTEFLQNQKTQILKLEADALELNLNCWCTSRYTLGIITIFASDQYLKIYSDRTNLDHRV
ncbi:Hypothetical_protein [Hexamita inflata]|uniref:Hypothetical_protein n=1 Tax=Hexamita inflata TaxID=28002 RepID=A0ABP1KC92_9EUKA